MSRNDIEWTSQKIWQLIELYRANEFLWDPSNVEYKCRMKKNETWDNIAAEIGGHRREVEGKVHILKSQYAREKKRIAIGQIPDSKWVYFEPLSFLPYTPDVAKHQSSSNEISNTTTSSTTYTQDVETVSSHSTPTYTPNPNPSTFKTSAKRKAEEFEFFDVVPKPKIEEQGRDEFDIYGDYVASELRNTGTEEATLIAKYKINKILLDMRLGRLRRSGARENNGIVKRETLDDDDSE